jgi:hypothetical protein
MIQRTFLRLLTRTTNTPKYPFSENPNKEQQKTTPPGEAATQKTSEERKRKDGEEDLEEDEAPY